MLHDSSGETESSSPRAGAYCEVASSTPMSHAATRYSCCAYFSDTTRGGSFLRGRLGISFLTRRARGEVSTRADRPDVLIMGGSFYYNCHYATSDLDLNPRALHHIAASRTLAVITSSRSLAVSVKGLARSLALSSRPRSHTHAVIIGVHRRCGDVGQHLGPRSLARAVISSSAPRSHAHAVITSSRCRRTCRGKTASTDSCGRGTFMGPSR